jgi:hypothetical protein
MNMYVLLAAGTAIEQRWGWWRFLIIYLVSAWWGSCLAMARAPLITCVGASGALCGVLAAELVWVLLTSRHVPVSMARRGRTQIFTTIVLLVIISLIPGVSGWGHLGGGIGGALAALVLHFQRFGPPAARWLAPLALLPLPWLGWATIQYPPTRSMDWVKVEFEASIPAAKALFESAAKLADEFDGLVDVDPERREREKVEEALAVLPGKEQELRAMAERLSSMKPLEGKKEEVREAGAEYALALADLLGLMEKHLRERPRWTAKLEKEWKQRQKDAEKAGDNWTEARR